MRRYGNNCFNVLTGVLDAYTPDLCVTTNGLMAVASRILHLFFLLSFMCKIGFDVVSKKRKRRFETVHNTLLFYSDGL
jgi:hypothetical protein